MVTGKTIANLTYLETPTADTLIPVELNGLTYHIDFSSVTGFTATEQTLSSLTVDDVTVNNDLVVSGNTTLSYVVTDDIIINNTLSINNISVDNSFVVFGHTNLSTSNIDDLTVNNDLVVSGSTNLTSLDVVGGSLNANGQTNLTITNINDKLTISSPVPSSLIGSDGDTDGLVAIDENGIYYCSQNYEDFTFNVTCSNFDGYSGLSTTYLPPPNDETLGSYIFVQGPFEEPIVAGYTIDYNSTTYVIVDSLDTGDENSRIYFSNYPVVENDIPASVVLTIKKQEQPLIWKKSTYRTYSSITGIITQNGTLDSQIISAGTLTLGTTYEISDNSGGADFTVVGAPNNLVGTKFIPTSTTPSWGTGYLTFDNGTPSLQVLENSFGTKIYSERIDDGTFLLTLESGSFDTTKTIPSLKLGFYSSPKVCFADVWQDNNSSIIIYFEDNLGSATNINGNAFFDIKIYN